MLFRRGKNNSWAIVFLLMITITNISCKEKECDLTCYLPLMEKAIKFAENNSHNHGVLSVKTNNPNQVLRNSVQNNFCRWVAGDTPAPWIKKKPKKFIDFMQARWAPARAHPLNKHWAPNVRMYFRRNTTHREYKMLQRLNFI